MDQVTLAIITGLIANGLTVFATNIARDFSGAFKATDTLAKSPELTQSLENILNNSAFAANLDDDTLGDQLRRLMRLKEFLASPEAEQIIREIYANQLNDADDSTTKAIRNHLAVALSLALGQPKVHLRKLSNALFKAMQEGSRHVIEKAIDDGVLSAHESKSAVRHKIILDQLENIQNTLAFIKSSGKPNLRDIYEFETQYRDQVAKRHWFITPPNFDTAQKVPIDDLYVSPDFVREPSKKDDEPIKLERSILLGGINRVVVLGNPGSGKSTFLLKLCHDLATKYSDRLFAGRLISPILVVLRDYGAEKRRRKCSILDFISITANSNYQVEPPRNCFEYLLLCGRAVVFFDGLDELLDSAYRQEISGDIDAFCNLYPAVPVVVTSRRVGYEQAPLDSRTFDTYFLSDFNDDQVREYVEKWFSVLEKAETESSQNPINAFLKESEIVPDLRRNPLMLALLCNIYRGENYIPRNRPDVYEKCATMLFERWDKSRGLHVPLPFEAHVGPAMKFLAHWIYSDESLQGGVTERELVAKSTEYLCPRRFEDPDEAERAAGEFIKFCKGRAWVFTDTGTTESGEGLYQFTHRTFLEYFTAAHLIRTYPTPETLGSHLRPRIAKREMDVVAQLAFQLLNKNVESGGDDLLDQLLDHAGKARGRRQWNLLSFAGRCLDFLVPSPKQIRRITEVCVEWYINYISSPKRGYEKQRSFRQRPDELLGSLVRSGMENRSTVASSLTSILETYISGSDSEKALIAGDIALRFTYLLRRSSSVVSDDDDTISFWAECAHAILKGKSEKMREFCKRDIAFCSRFIWTEEGVSTGEAIEWHGLRIIFAGTRPRAFPFIRQLPLAWLLMFYPHRTSDKRSALDYLNALDELGRVLTSTPAPWTSPADQSSGYFEYWVCKREHEKPNSDKPLPNLSPDGNFALFAIGAVFLEISLEEAPKIIEALTDRFDTFLRRYVTIYSARFGGTKNIDVDGAIGSGHFSDEQNELVLRWALRQIDFVKAKRRKRGTTVVSQDVM